MIEFSLSALAKHQLNDAARKPVTWPMVNRGPSSREDGRDATAQRARREKEYRSRRMIAWDGEGMNLSGKTKPQHYVLFGCSAEPNRPLIGRKLQFVQIAEYMLGVAQRHPGAFHVGYFFGYDQNMILESLPWTLKHRIYDTGSDYYRRDKVSYRISYVHGKKLRITKYTATDRKGKKRPTILIEDIAAFWAQSFVEAYRQTFPDAESDPTFQRVVEGKKLRSSMLWEDMPTVRDYWEHEIVALERLAQRLKDMMTDAEYPLRSWYGPGAFANHIRRQHKLKEHEAGGKEDALPAAVHHAVKCAYFGGHFEQFRVGRVQGPVWALDINSAYPAAFTTVPTMREGGFWQQIPTAELLDDARSPRQPLTLYKVNYLSHEWYDAFGAYGPEPLPHRDQNGHTSYPYATRGWYWAPEVTAVVNAPEHTCMAPDITVLDGWRWVPVDDSRPWENVIRPMFEKRQELKASGDPAQMVFKLGPNSLYGKAAQRVGFNKETMAPPQPHTLAIAGYITSWCRAMIMRLVHAHRDFLQIIAVETDGLYTTVSPELLLKEWPELAMSSELGDWSVKQYDEMIYIQNGVYLMRTGEDWQTKTRGFPAGTLNPEMAGEYLSRCEPKTQYWPEMPVETGETFIGLGAAINRARNQQGKLNPFKAAALHCSWWPETKSITAGGIGKRQHKGMKCIGCNENVTPNVQTHWLVGCTQSTFTNPDSHPYSLPWEADYKEEQWRSLAVADSGTIRQT